MKKWFILVVSVSLLALYAQDTGQDTQSIETEMGEEVMDLSDGSETPIEQDVQEGMAALVEQEGSGEPDGSAVGLNELELPNELTVDEKGAQPAILDESLPEHELREDDDIIKGFHTVPKVPVQEAPLAVEDLTFNIEQKEKQVIDLVNRAARELQNKPLDVACNRFSHTKDFIYGDLYIFVYDTQGTCFAHGDDSHLIWKNLYELRDQLGMLIIQEIIKKAKAGGGWVTYGWHNSTKVSYVQLVEKEGKTYVIGSGYYPHSKEEAVVNLVKGGVELFNQTKTNGQPVDWAFSRMSYPSGQFVSGNLYLYALDFKGNIAAQGERPGLINSNAWDYRDENGLYVNREIVNKLKNTTEGVWVEYISKRAKKKAYAEKVTGKNGKQYFIACGYYPDADREKTVDLVRQGYQFMKVHGKTNSVERFSQRRSDDFRYGDLYLMVYDLKGRIIADGGNADNIGQVVINDTDEDGFEYIKSMLRRATKDGVWTNSKIKGSFKSTFAMRIDIGIGQYVIAASYYPISKAETMVLLVESGVSFLKSHPRTEAFEQFVQASGKFRRGDLELVVVDTSGLCYAYGNDFDLIWRNIFMIEDQKGRPFIKIFINESEHGDTVIKTKLNNATKINYVSSVEKEGKTYVVSSGYYE
jgi:signal transduction histidine kinase